MKCHFCNKEMPEDTFACSHCMELCVIVHPYREAVRKILAFYDKPVHAPDCGVAVNGRLECNCRG